MKQNKRILFCIGLNFCLYHYIDSCNIGPADVREWDIASLVLTLAQTIQSNAASLNVTITEDFSGTFTALQALNVQAVSLQSMTSTIDAALNQISSNVSMILSEMAIISSEINVIEYSLAGIHVNSFGGTWTALTALENTILNNTQSVESQIATMNAFVDSLSITALVQFVATATNLEQLSSEVLATTTSVQALSNQINADFSDISSLMMITNDQLASTSAQLATLISTVQYDFAGTFTVINFIEQKLLGINNRLVFFEEANSFNDTVANLQALENALFTVSSKLDTTIALTSVVQANANAIVN